VGLRKEATKCKPTYCGCPCFSSIQNEP